MGSKNIIISNPKKLEEIKKKMGESGKDKLHVIADFDRTLTRSFFKGKRNPAIIAHIRHEGYLTPDYPKKAFALFDKYHPIEISTKISLKEKKKKMQKWWRKHFDLLIECGMNEGVIKDIIKNKKISLRKGAFKFFDSLEKQNVPLIIMSAGPGDMIKEYLI